MDNITRKEIKFLIGGSFLVLLVAALLATFSSNFSFDYICARTQPQIFDSQIGTTAPVRMIAQVSVVAIDKVAFFASGDSLSANVTDENAKPLYLIITTAKSSTYSTVLLDGKKDLLSALRAHQVEGVVANNLSLQSAKTLRANNIATYSGVFGHVKDVIPLYQSGQLLAMR